MEKEDDTADQETVGEKTLPKNLEEHIKIA